MRFLRQRDQYSCGPVSVINALKWAGLPLSYRKHYKKIKKKCKTDKGWGTYTHNITKTLGGFKEIWFETVPLITYRQLKDHLMNGGAAILEYWYREDDGSYDGHYAFVYMTHDLEFVVVNDMWTETVKRVEPNYIKEKLRCRKYRSTGSPSAWLIRKVNEDEKIDYAF